MWAIRLKEGFFEEVVLVWILKEQVRDGEEADLADVCELESMKEVYNLLIFHYREHNALHITSMW